MKVKTALLAIAAILLMIAIPVQAQTTVTLGFYNITHNIGGDETIGETQLFVDVTEVVGEEQVLFTFRNTGPEASSICDVYFDDGSVLSLLSIALIDDSGPGVDFDEGASPGDLPGGGSGFSADFSADSEPPTQPNGVNPGDSLGILFNLQPGTDFAGVLADLASGDLRIGIHVQGFDSGGSESFINDPPGEEPPEEGTIIIVKYADPPDGTDFSFTGGNLGDFWLDYADPDDGDPIPSSKTFLPLTPATYPVSETISSGWTLASILCSDPDGGTASNLGEATATIDLDAGEVVVCVFTNIKSTAIALPSSSFTAEASAGSVTLAWETGTEIDNAGFNLYRALLKDGPYTRINEALIAAQGDAVSGGSYSFVDAPDYGTFYYKLEDVDYYGVSTLHGPVRVTVARPLRRPLYRPRLPEF